MSEIIEFFATIKKYSLFFHVLFVVFGMGAAVAGDILFQLYAKDQKLNSTEGVTLSALSRVVWNSLFGIYLTGVTIVLSDPHYYLTSSKFLAKMSIVSLITLNGYLIYHFIEPRLKDAVSDNDSKAQVLSLYSGSFSLASWISALYLGVLDKSYRDFFEIMSIYAVFVFIAWIGAMVFKKHVFRH